MKLFGLMNALSLIALSLLLSIQLFARNELTDSTGGQLTCTLTVQSNPESAYVNLDGKEIGATPLSIDSIIPGIHHLQIQGRDVESWLAQPVLDTVQLTAGEHRALTYNLRSRCFITSTPFGAEVILNDSVLGTTPFLIPPQFAQQPLLLRKQGYEQATVQFTGSAVAAMKLNKLWQDDQNADSHFKEANERSRKAVGLYTAGAVTILSGVTAAYLKIKADNRYQQYLLEGDTKLLSQTHRLDTGAGIAIVVTQIGLGLFTYFILSQ